ncbi:hypothetical protein [Halorubrum sp. 2020YC2]|uniref:hypothetical protein n=1 Tax=Halorubrum sp. 2020YC2 TaxID=2836432 RepID=UPI001BE76002|nr:hypothetical protein [Halorubrum sp. 2020YC2]QWC18721.1 hypothetical protein KI388_11380 [Halorubrum sp. 2020YC2]
MNRRQLLAGLGAAAAGGGAALGTGAFTSVEADRSVNVSVADEDQAYLAISPASSANSNFAFQDTSSGGKNQLSLDFNAVNGVTGQGVGNSSDYSFDGVFVVENQGTQDLDIYIEQLSAGDFEDGPGTGNSPNGTLDVEFYPGSSSDSPLTASDAASSNSVSVSLGSSQLIGVNIDIGNVDVKSWEADVTIEAEG